MAKGKWVLEWVDDDSQPDVDPDMVLAELIEDQDGFRWLAIDEGEMVTMVGI